MKTQHISRRLRRFLKATKAVSALEYAVLVGVVTVGVGGAIVIFSDNIETAITGIGNNIGATTNTVGNTNLNPQPTA